MTGVMTGVKGAFIRASRRLSGYIRAKGPDLLNAEDLTLEERHRLYLLAEAARRKFEAARVLFDARMPHAALLLYQKAALEMAEGLPSPGPQDAEQASGGLGNQLGSRLEAGGVRAKLAEVAARVFEMDGASLDALPRAEARALCQQMDALGASLVDRVRPRLPTEIRRRKVGRWVALAASAFALPFLAYSWVHFPRNVAINKPVTVSSQHEVTPPASVVDGDNHFNYPAFRTAREDGPWLEVDLLRPHVITDVHVYGPHRCCFADSVPLVVEISLDGINYEVVGRRTDPLVPAESWHVVSIKGTARHVRVRSEGKRILHLTEVSIFGRPAG